MNRNILINIGDLLTRPKTLGFVDHYGVVVSPNTVLQNTPEKGEHLASVDEFAAGQRISVIRTSANPLEVQARCRKSLANRKAYNLVNRNCEHTAFEVAYGIAKSPQFIAAIIIGVIIFLAILVLQRR